MTERERFIRALKRQPIEGHCPTFELVFFLTLEAIGRIHPSHLRYDQWKQMSAREQQLQLDYQADTYIETAEKYHHSAIFVHPVPDDLENTVRLLEAIREKSGDKYYLTMHGDCTFSIPDGNGMMAFSERMYEDEDGLKADAQRMLENSVRFAEGLAKHPGLLDGFTLCADYCFNVNPFFSPSQFGEFVAPYLERIIKEYHGMGFYSVKHTDGNIMPILDQMVQCGPDALHSLDPQGGVDLAEVKRLYGDRVALCGNVNCGLLQTGTDEEVRESALYAIRSGKPGGGYIFSTSNVPFRGLDLNRYLMILDIWKENRYYTDESDMVYRG